VKSFFVYSLATLLLGFCASAQTGPDIPVIQVRTEGHTAKAINTPRPYSKPSKHPKPVIVEIQRVNVRVDLRSFTTPKVPYDIQCFAIAGSPADRSKYIYDVQHRSSSAAYDTVLFQTALIEEKKKWVLIPITSVAATGKVVSASPVITKPVKGAKYYGWVVRVISNNVAVRHESNQPELRIAAEKTPAAFDTAVAEID
jgi:hypothetical protein